MGCAFYMVFEISEKANMKKGKKSIRVEDNTLSLLHHDETSTVLKLLFQPHRECKAVNSYMLKIRGVFITCFDFYSYRMPK